MENMADVSESQVTYLEKKDPNKLICLLSSFNALKMNELVEVWIWNEWKWRTCVKEKLFAKFSTGCYTRNKLEEQVNIFRDSWSHEQNILLGLSEDPIGKYKYEHSTRQN